MPSKNKTPLGLSQWVGGDRPKMNDFNSDNQKIDLACRSVLESLSLHLEEKSHLTQELAQDLENAHLHTIEGVATEAGMHGIRYFENKLQVNVGGIWVDCSTGKQGGKGGTYKVYGVCIDTENKNPSAAVTYTDDAVGMTAGSTDWDQELFVDIRPCMVRQGAVQYYLDPGNYSKKEDGTPSGHTTGDNGDVMVEIPRMAYAIYKEGGRLYVKVTTHPNAKLLDPRFCYLAHTRAAEGDRQRLFIGAYLANEADGKLRSLSGKTAVKNKIIGECRQKARANGDGYDLLGFYPFTLLQCLYLIRFKSLDSQAALGTGYTDISPPTTTGGTDAKGFYFGDSSYQRQVKCFGIEDLWGNLFYYLDGIHIGADGVLFSGHQNFSDDYNGYPNQISFLDKDLAGYVLKVHGDNFTGFLAREVAGNGYNYFCDYAQLVRNTVCYAGGNYLSWIEAGLFSVNFTLGPAVSKNNVGARLMCL